MEDSTASTHKRIYPGAHAGLALREGGGPRSVCQADDGTGLRPQATPRDACECVQAGQRQRETGRRAGPGRAGQGERASDACPIQK